MCGKVEQSKPLISRFIMCFLHKVSYSKMVYAPKKHVNRNGFSDFRRAKSLKNILKKGLTNREFCGILFKRQKRDKFSAR